jgi:hypothetical protein
VFNAVVLFAAFMLIGGCIPARAQNPPARPPVQVRALENGQNELIIITEYGGQAQVTFDRREWLDIRTVTNGVTRITCSFPGALDYRLLENPHVKTAPQPVRGLPDIRKAGVDAYGTRLESGPDNKPQDNKQAKTRK